MLRQVSATVLISKSYIVAWLRRDGFVLLMYLITLCIMTFPLVIKLSDIVPLTNADTYTAMWQNWWMREALFTGKSLTHTDLLFYPNGLDLTLQPRRWITFPVWLLLYELFGDPAAFNLVGLLGVFVKAYAMYLVILSLTNNRFASWVGGAFFAFASRSLSLALQQPNTGATEFIPLFMLLWIYLLSYITKDSYRLRRWRNITLITALVFAANIYMNLKIGIFAAIIGGLYLLWHMIIHAELLNRRLWYTLLLFSVCVLIVSAPIIIPTASSDYLDIAIDETDIGAGADLLAFVKADIFQPWFYNNYFAQFAGVPLTEFAAMGLTHIGFLSIIMTLIGTIYILRSRRSYLIWVLMALLFFGLSLGLQITYKLEPVDIVSPYSLVVDNVLFRALRSPYRFAMLMLFPMSIVIALAICSIANVIRKRNVLTWFGAIILVVLMLFETSIFPISHRSAGIAGMFTNGILGEEPGAVINIPMGRQESKYHMYTQMWHHRPINEGMIARIPPDTYSYIESNPVLRDWRSLFGKMTLTLEDWYRGTEDLLEDRFRYVVVHKYVVTGRDVFTTNEQRERYFSQAPALWEDVESRVYDLEVLRQYPPHMLLERLPFIEP